MLDVLIIAGLTLGLLLGLKTGLVKQAIGIAGIVAGVAVGVALMEQLGELVTRSLGISENISPVVGFVLAFLAVQLAVGILARLLEGIVGFLHLSFLNRLAGGAIGAAKACLVMSVLFLVLGNSSVPGENARAESMLYEPVASSVPWAWEAVRGIFPEVVDLTERFGERAIEYLPNP